MTDTAPHAGIGGNLPPLTPTLLDADDLAKRFELDYGAFVREVAEVLATIRDEAPTVVETDADNGIIARHMEALRKTIKSAGAKHDAEKAPYLQAGRVVDQFFNALTDRLGKARTILQARGDAFTQRKVAAERAERERIARAAAAAAREAQIEADRVERERRELEAAAARARKPENIERLEGAAQVAGIASVEASIEQMVTESQHQVATAAAAASSADIARNRFETGHLATAKQVPFVEITDGDLLDKIALWPFIDDKAKLAALKAWAKTKNHKVQMAGAIVEMRDAASYR